MTPPLLTPITGRQTIATAVYQQLRSALMEGIFEAGSSFAISDLAARFGTSNTPVREALRRLTDEGALVEGKWNSATLPPLSARSYGELCLARRVIEGGATELACDRLDADGLEELHAISESHQQALVEGRVEDMVAGNKAFHFRIYRATGSGILMEQIENLWLRSGPYTRFLGEKMREMLKADMTLSYARTHDRILEALTAKDALAAREAMMDDIRAVECWMSQVLNASGPSPHAGAMPASRSRGVS